MLEFQFTATVRENGSIRKVAKKIRAENKMAATIDLRKELRKKGQDVHAVIDCRAFRVRFDKKRVELTDEELWNIEHKRELDAPLTC